MVAKNHWQLALSKRAQLVPVGIIALISIGLMVAVTLDFFPYLRGPNPGGYEWRWRHTFPPDIVLWKLIFPCAAGTAIGLWASWNPADKLVTRARLLILVALAVGFRLAVQETSAYGLGVVARVVNPGYFGYFPAATEVDEMPTFLHDYADVQKTLAYRLTTHPPGNVVFYWLIIRAIGVAEPLLRPIQPAIEQRIAAWPPDMQIYSATDVVAAAFVSLLVPALSALSVIPLYDLARRIFDARAAWWAALLAVLVPAFTLFTPVTDDLYTLIFVSGLWFAVCGLTNKTRRMLFVAGVIVGSSLFQSLSNIPMVVTAGLFVGLHSLLNRQSGWLPRLYHAAVFAAGVPLVWLLVWLAFGLNPIRVFINCLTNYEAHIRSYWLSVIYNPWDILLFAGAPVAIYFLLAVVRLGQRLWQRQFQILPDSLLIGFLLAMLLLDIAGSLRGETARTLLYVFPMLVLFAAGDISRKTGLSRFYAPLVLGLMALQTLVFQATLVVYH